GWGHHPGAQTVRPGGARADECFAWRRRLTGRLSLGVCHPSQKGPGPWSGSGVRGHAAFSWRVRAIISYSWWAHLLFPCTSAAESPAPRSACGEGRRERPQAATWTALLPRLIRVSLSRENRERGGRCPGSGCRGGPEQNDADRIALPSIPGPFLAQPGRHSFG